MQVLMQPKIERLSPKHALNFETPNVHSVCQKGLPRLRDLAGATEQGQAFLGNPVSVVIRRSLMNE